MSWFGFKNCAEITIEERSTAFCKPYCSQHCLLVTVLCTAPDSFFTFSPGVTWIPWKLRRPSHSFKNLTWNLHSQPSKAWSAAFSASPWSSASLKGRGKKSRRKWEARGQLGGSSAVPTAGSYSWALFPSMVGRPRTFLSIYYPPCEHEDETAKKTGRWTQTCKARPRGCHPHSCTGSPLTCPWQVTHLSFWSQAPDSPLEEDGFPLPSRTSH